MGETADRFWAAEQVLTGHRNISNCMSITTKIDKCSKDLKSKAKENGWWTGRETFNWTEVIGGSTGELVNPSSRWSCGRKLLAVKSRAAKFDPEDMMSVLRDEDSGINMSGGGFPTTGSQVSLLSGNPAIASCHWFTATQGPSRSVFKPFLFSPNGCPSDTELTTSPNGDDLTPKEQVHPLWSAHTKRRWGSALKRALIEDLEKRYIKFGEKERSGVEQKNLFRAAVHDEMELWLTT